MSVQVYLHHNRYFSTLLCANCLSHFEAYKSLYTFDRRSIIPVDSVDPAGMSALLGVLVSRSCFNMTNFLLPLHEQDDVSLSLSLSLSLPDPMVCLHIILIILFGFAFLRYPLIFLLDLHARGRYRVCFCGDGGGGGW